MEELTFLEAYKEYLEKKVMIQLVKMLIICVLLFVFANLAELFFSGFILSCLMYEGIKTVKLQREQEDTENALNQPVEVYERVLGYEKD